MHLFLPPLRRLLLHVVGHVHVRFQVHLAEPDGLGPLHDLPAQIHDQHDGQLDVVADKADAVKLGAEAAPALDQDDDNVEKDAEVRPDGIRPVAEGQQMRLALALEGGAEADGRDADGDPAELVRDTDEAVTLVQECGLLPGARRTFAARTRAGRPR